MFKISRSMTTETAHLLINHSGGCANIHGHSYVWKVTLKGEHLRSGMLIDFSDLKEIMTSSIQKYDHALVVDRETYVIALSKEIRDLRTIVMDVRPTAENMAKNLFHEIKYMLPHDIKVHKVSCRETADCEATYYEEY